MMGGSAPPTTDSNSKSVSWACMTLSRFVAASSFIASSSFVAVPCSLLLLAPLGPNRASPSLAGDQWSCRGSPARTSWPGCGFHYASSPHLSGRGASKEGYEGGPHPPLNRRQAPTPSSTYYPAPTLSSTYCPAVPRSRVVAWHLLRHLLRCG